MIRKAIIRRPSRSRERTALHQLYAAKIAAARLTADRRELVAIIAALRSEERAALDALKIVKPSRAKKRNSRARPFRAGLS